MGVRGGLGCVGHGLLREFIELEISRWLFSARLAFVLALTQGARAATLCVHLPLVWPVAAHRSCLGTCRGNFLGKFGGTGQKAAIEETRTIQALALGLKGPLGTLWSNCPQSMDGD